MVEKREKDKDIGSKNKKENERDEEIRALKEEVSSLKEKMRESEDSDEEESIEKRARAIEHVDEGGIGIEGYIRQDRAIEEMPIQFQQQLRGGPEGLPGVLPKGASSEYISLVNSILAEGEGENGEKVDLLRLISKADLPPDAVPRILATLSLNNFIEYTDGVRSDFIDKFLMATAATTMARSRKSRSEMVEVLTSTHIPPVIEEPKKKRSWWERFFG